MKGFTEEEVERYEGLLHDYDGPYAIDEAF